MIENIDTFNIKLFNNIKNIGITASASAPEKLVKNLIDKLSYNYDLNIIESNYEIENVHFKIPHKLKEAI